MEYEKKLRELEDLEKRHKQQLDEQERLAKEEEERRRQEKERKKREKEQKEQDRKEKERKEAKERKNMEIDLKTVVLDTFDASKNPSPLQIEIVTQEPTEFSSPKQVTFSEENYVHEIPTREQLNKDEEESNLDSLESPTQQKLTTASKRPNLRPVKKETSTDVPSTPTQEQSPPNEEGKKEQLQSSVKKPLIQRGSLPNPTRGAPNPGRGTLPTPTRGAPKSSPTVQPSSQTPSVTEGSEKEIKQESPKPTNQEPLRDVKKEPLKEVKQEPPKPTNQEPLRDVKQEPLKEVKKESPKEVPKTENEGSKSILKKGDSGGEVSKNSQPSEPENEFFKMYQKKTKSSKPKGEEDSPNTERKVEPKKTESPKPEPKKEEPNKESPKQEVVPKKKRKI